MDSRKPLTFDEIHAQMIEIHKDRDENKMKATLTAQIGGKKRPLRYEREKDIKFKITETEVDGKPVKKYFLKKNGG